MRTPLANNYQFKVSVLMPVYNSSSFIKEAVESILNQTYTNFELLIYDDHSTDNTIELVEGYKDSRITLFRKDKNTGYTNSLIMGITKSTGKYIARMDSDDISDLKRFEKQVNFLEANPEYGIVGSQLKTIATDEASQVWSYPATDEDIRLHTIIDSPFAHPSVMIRKDVLDKHELSYDASFEPSEDYKLWVDLLKVTKGANINEVLVYYRLHKNQTISTKKNIRIKNSNLIRQEIVKDFFDCRLTDEELMVHYYYFNEISINSSGSIMEKYMWRKKMLGWFDESDFHQKARLLVEEYWVINLRTLSGFRPSFIKFIFNKFLVKNFSILETFKFGIKCLVGYKVSKSI